MTYLFDTNALRDVMDENAQMRDRLTRAATSHKVLMPVIAQGEILFGIERMPTGKRKDAVSQKAALVLASIQIESVPAAAGIHYARIKRSREELGRPMDENDLWIAATAMALAATLVTRDNDFKDIPGLIVEDWTV